MLLHHFKTAFRNLRKNRLHSVLNIAGLSIGMAVAMLIGLWIQDEFSFNKQFKDYDHIAQVMWNYNYNSERISLAYNPYPMGEELKNSYGGDFKYVTMSTFTDEYVLTDGNNKFMKKGNFMEPEASDMLSLHMVKGSKDGLKNPTSILLSASLANAIYHDTDPIGRILKMDDKENVKVTGVYEDLPYNSDFKDLSFIAPWELYVMMNPEVKTQSNPWTHNKFQTFVRLADAASVQQVSDKLRNLRVNKLPSEEARVLQPVVFLHLMPRWHLYSPFNDGAKRTEQIQNVWLFGIIGVFVLLLACINFMNLSTARTEKRAKEVGIRKTIGSVRSQLICQFFSESLLAVVFAFILALVWVSPILPFFNEVADKKLGIPWLSPVFWLSGIIFILLTGFIAGLYPALYLSSFQPVKVLKGTFRAGKLAALPRKVLVVLQFTVSVILIIGTIVVYRQIEYSRNRSIGYNSNGLIMVPENPAIHQHFNTIREELKAAQVVSEMGESVNTTTDFNVGDTKFQWQGKSQDLPVDFAISNVTYEYGKTIGWQIMEGRDFSRNFLTDSTAFVLNEAAAKLIGFKHPVGETILWDNKPFHVIGVVKNIVFESPYSAVSPAIFHMSGGQNRAVTLRINPHLSVTRALAQITAIFNKYNPEYPFTYKFVDQEYGKKFDNEQRIGKLSGFFAGLAIFISCLGLFGMASFMAEQRTKELGVRKVLGASVFTLWRLMSKDLVILVLIALLIASPTAYIFMHNWLLNYEYRPDISLWLFIMVGVGALAIALLTVSYQIIKAALSNPINSLRAD
jgi:putative ABC transport system permease protein